jgi:hypothetical protein
VRGRQEDGVAGIEPEKGAAMAERKHIDGGELFIVDNKNLYLRQVQAPIGVKPILKAWMELT